jgi:hypothetical protein
VNLRPLVLSGGGGLCRPPDRRWDDTSDPYDCGYPAGVVAAKLADAIRLVEKVVAVAQRFLCILIDRNGAAWTC